MKRLLITALAACSIGLTTSANAFVLDFEGIHPGGSALGPVHAVIDGFGVSVGTPGAAGIAPVGSTTGSGLGPGYNGTDHLALLGPNSVTFTRASGFSISSIDITGHIGLGPQTVFVDVIRLDAVVEGTLLQLVNGTADGLGGVVDFETLSYPAVLPDDFGSLVLTSITFTGTAFSVDNFAGTLVSAPEPGTVAVFGAALVLLGWRRRQANRS
jgi:hypothetical protein